MNEKQEEMLARYRELWADLNAVNSLMDDLAARRSEIKARQRQLANAIAKAGEDPAGI